mgnify:CR=1 FL=1|jgi:hypothetical protein
MRPDDNALGSAFWTRETFGLLPVEMKTKSACTTFPLSNLTVLIPLCAPTLPSHADGSETDPADGIDTRSERIKLMCSAASCDSIVLDSFSGVGGLE